MEGEVLRFIKRMFSTGGQQFFYLQLKSIGNHRVFNRIWDMSKDYNSKGKGPIFILPFVRQLLIHIILQSLLVIRQINKRKETGGNVLLYYFTYLPLP